MVQPEAGLLFPVVVLDPPSGQVAMVDDVPEFIAGARAVGMHGLLHRTARETAAKVSALLLS